VWIGQSYDNVVSHCEIADLYYTAISVGWTWGYGPSLARGNVIEHNHIHHLGRRSDGDGPILSDMACVYTLGVQPGTVVRHNRVHDVQAARYGGWGIYFDEGSSNILAENNVVYRTRHGGFHQHYGRDNVFRNNILALQQERQIERSRPEAHRSFTFERNVVYWNSGQGIMGNWTGPSAFNVVFDRNCYWAFGDGKPWFAYVGWDEWRKKGMDEHSVMADPLFVDAAKDDFRLKPESPALKVGFVLFDQTGVGPRP
jgi:parallel beta-helix repeat protein